MRGLKEIISIRSFALQSLIFIDWFRSEREALKIRFSHKIKIKNVDKNSCW